MKQNVIQRAEKQPKQQGPNLTGIPTQMKLDFERRSGLSFDDVRVHYNSDKPTRIGALAYTQGTRVYMAPGQERHLGHELGHVIQQKSFRVPPTSWINGQPVNDSPALECQADFLSSFPCAISHSEDGRRKQYPIQKLSIQISVDDETDTINVPAPDDPNFNAVVRYLYSEIIVRYFNEREYQFFRIPKYFRDFMIELVQEQPEGEMTAEALAEAFVSSIEDRTMRVGRNEIPVLRTFDAASMGRPSWTKEIRNQLSARKREDVGKRADIRHVVRNYLLKAAIKTAIERSSLAEVAEAARKLLKDDNPEDSTMVRRLYTVLYRNIDNLWMGDSAMNQLIGFLANVFDDYGNRLISAELLAEEEEFEEEQSEEEQSEEEQSEEEQSEEEQSEEEQSEEEEQGPLADFLKEFSRAVWAKSKLILKKFPQHSMRIQSQVREYLDLVHNYAYYAVQNGLALRDIGYFIIDIGDTLGFDLIDDLSPDSQSRTARLLEVASFLTQYISGPSNINVEGLMDYFEQFLGLENQETSDTDGSDQANGGEQTVEESMMDEDVLDAESQEEDPALFQINNCLITAIANHSGISLSNEAIAQIRMNLSGNFAVPPGVFLNADDANVVAGIFVLMGIQNAVLVVHDTMTGMYNAVIPAFGVFTADNEDAVNAHIQQHCPVPSPTIISIKMRRGHFY